MTYLFSTKLYHKVILALTFFFTLGVAGLEAKAQSRPVYTPIPLAGNNEVSDRLTEKDIPTGDGGFARDYTVKLNAGEQIAVDVSSDNFDAIVVLMAIDGTTVGQNDDGPDGSNNSLLFARIKDAGTYIVRVRAFGETGNGSFRLKVTRLRQI
jgi:hypothetical protein